MACSRSAAARAVSVAVACTSASSLPHVPTMMGVGGFGGHLSLQEYRLARIPFHGHACPGVQIQGSSQIDDLNHHPHSIRAEF